MVGFGALRHDLRRGSLPRFSWIAPNLVHDGHNASVRASDRFAAPSCRASSGRSARDGVLFVTWDEAQGATGPAGGRVALIATGPGARLAVRSTAPADHYSLLATIEVGPRPPEAGARRHGAGGARYGTARARLGRRGRACRAAESR